MVAGAINLQIARDVAPSWKVSAKVEVFLDLDAVPRGSMIVLVSDDVNGKGGIHYRPDTDTTFALVQFTRDWRWAVAVSHEILEWLIDPSLHGVIAGRRADRPMEEVRYLLEVCHPCQSLACAYPIDETQQFYVSDFCLPAYYEIGDSIAGPFSFRGSIAAPWTVAGGGYLTWMDDSDRFNQLSAARGKNEIVGPFSRDAVFGHHPIGRNLRGTIDRSLVLGSRMIGSPFTVYDSRRAAARSGVRLAAGASHQKDRVGRGDVNRFVASLVQGRTLR
jgi:hypothetical protein